MGFPTPHLRNFRHKEAKNLTLFRANDSSVADDIGRIDPMSRLVLSGIFIIHKANSGSFESRLGQEKSRFGIRDFSSSKQEEAEFNLLYVL